MDFRLVLLYVLTFVFGPAVIVWGLALMLRCSRLKKHGKRATADVERVSARKRSLDVDLVWTDENGARREDTVYLNSGLFGAEVGKTLEIYYDDNHVMAANRRPYVLHLVIGTICIALGILTVTLNNYF